MAGLCIKRRRRRSSLEELCRRDEERRRGRTHRGVRTNQRARKVELRETESRF